MTLKAAITATILLATVCQDGAAQSVGPGKGVAFDLPMVDAHTQIDGDTEMEVVLRNMDRAGIGRALLSPRFRRPPADILALARAHPDRITATVRTKTKAYFKGRKGTAFFRKFLKREIAAGDYGAIAEVIMWHAQKGNRAGQFVIAPDHERVQVYLDAAIAHGWPFIIHIEFAAAGADRAPFMAMMRAMLRRYPDHPMALIHMGQIDDPDEARALIEAHPNLHFLTSHCNPITMSDSRQPWANLFDGENIKPAWAALMTDHPDRFILAFDNVFPEHWGGYYISQARHWRRALRDLPEEVAHAIAHRNAERLWRLPPTPSKF